MKRLIVLIISVLLLSSLGHAAAIEYFYPSGSTLYAIVWNSADDTVWNGATFETWADGNVGTYDIPLTKAPGASQKYYATFPVGIAAGTYSVAIHLQAAGAPAVGDTLIGADSMGTTGLPQVNVKEWNGVAVPTLGSPAGASIMADIATLQADSDLYDTDAEYAAAIWNALTAGYGGAGSYGEMVEAVFADTDAYDSDAEYATAIWNAAVASYGGAGTYGQAAEDTLANIGTPVALDGGAATVGGMLTKMADDNGGATFDATNDSLHELYVQIGDPNGGTVAASFGIIEAFVDSLENWIAAPVALDGGAATITGMLTKLADDAGGTDFDAGTDSQAELRDYIADVNSVLHAHIGDPNSGDSLAGDLAVIEGKVDSLEQYSGVVLDTTVASVTSTSQFTLTAGWAVEGAYEWGIITVIDVTTGSSASGFIVNYSAGRVVTLYEPLPFTPAAADPVIIQGWVMGPIFQPRR